MLSRTRVTCKSLSRTSSLAATWILGRLHISGIYCRCVNFKKHIKRNPGLLRSCLFTGFSEALKQKFLLRVPGICVVTYCHRIFCIFSIAVPCEFSMEPNGTHCSLVCSLPGDAAQGHSPRLWPRDHCLCCRVKPRVRSGSASLIHSVLIPKICLETEVLGIRGSSRDPGEIAMIG